MVTAQQQEQQHYCWKNTNIKYETFNIVNIFVCAINFNYRIATKLCTVENDLFQISCVITSGGGGSSSSDFK